MFLFYLHPWDQNIFRTAGVLRVRIRVYVRVKPAGGQFFFREWLMRVTIGEGVTKERREKNLTDAVYGLYAI